MLNDSLGGATVDDRCNRVFWFSKNVLNESWNFFPKYGMALTKMTALSISDSLKAMMTKIFCMCIFITALPINVAPKNVQNGTRKWPHVIPAKSNSGFGIYKMCVLMGCCCRKSNMENLRLHTPKSRRNRPVPPLVPFPISNVRTSSDHRRPPFYASARPRPLDLRPHRHRCPTIVTLWP